MKAVSSKHISQEKNETHWLFTVGDMLTQHLALFLVKFTFITCKTLRMHNAWCRPYIFVCWSDFLHMQTQVVFTTGELSVCAWWVANCQVSNEFKENAVHNKWKITNAFITGGPGAVIKATKGQKKKKKTVFFFYRRVIMNERAERRASDFGVGHENVGSE